MAGGRRRMRKPVPKTVKDLPTELLEFIFLMLNLKDNIIASAVCKRWLAVAVSLRPPNNPPLLMSFPKSGSQYQFYDPLSRDMYYADYPKLANSRIFYAKDGWLLAFKPRTCRVFLFHPYTRAVVKLPKRQALDNLAFSAAPTSSNCFIFTMANVSPTVIAIGTCRPGDAAWTTLTYQSLMPFISSSWNKVVFCKGLFCCLSLNGMLSLFDPVHHTWSITFVPPPICTYDQSVTLQQWQRGKFMAEHDGDIFLVYTCARKHPFMYKLNPTQGVWVQMNHLGDMTLFASSLSSVMRSGVHGEMRNNIYFSKVRFFGRRCVTYSPVSQRYYPQNRLFDWGKEDPFQSIWLDRPEEDVSDVFSRLEL